MRTRWLYRLIRRVFFDLGRSLWPLLLYDSIVAVLSFFVLSPLLSWAASSMASSDGRLSITNGEVLSFLFSFRGVLFVLLVGSLTAVSLYIKHAGMILIAWEALAGRPIGALRAVRAVVRRLPGLTLLGSYHVAAHVLLLAPFAVLGVLVYRLAFSSMRVYFLFLENPAARWAGLAVVSLMVAAAGVVHGAVFLQKPAARWAGLAVVSLNVAAAVVVHAHVYLHWVFSLPALLVDDRSVASALAYTHGLLKGTRRRIGAVVLVLWMAIILFPFALAQGYHGLGGRVFARLPEEHRLVLPVVLMLMAGYLAMSFLAEFLTVSVSSLTITHLYAHLRRARGDEKVEEMFDSEVAALPAPHGARSVHPRQIGVLVLLGAVVAVSVAAGILSEFELRDNVKITAHRGSSFRAPENTLAAIRQAIEDGADYAEIDVRLTADGYVVLLHDRDLYRVAGVKKNLSDMPYAQVRTLDVGGWFSPQFRGEGVPLLSEAVATAKGRIGLNVELKVESVPRRLAERVVQVLQEHDAAAECVVSSTSLEALEYVRALDPRIRRGYIVVQSIGEVAALDVDFLSVSARLVTPGLIDAARAAGKEVHVWSVNRPRTMVKFIDMGVDNLITGVPATARSLLDERAALSSEELLFLKVRSWFLR